MKARLSILFILFFSQLFAQVGIGTINPEGQLDIVSSTTGLVLPRVSRIENVRTPGGDLAVDGTAVYDISRDAVCYRMAGSWVCVEIDDAGNPQLNLFDIIYNGISNYVKASNTTGQDYFGSSLAISEDGMYLAVGAYKESSSSTGINGSESNSGANLSGAVYLFHRLGSVWTQEAFIKASNTGAFDEFGKDLAISSDGSRLVVSAHLEDSNATGIDGDQNDNSMSNSGAVYIFVRTGSNWAQEAYIKSSNSESGDEFGHSVSMSSSGDRIAVSAIKEDSNATGIAGDQNDNSMSNSGAVYLFERAGGVWSQIGYFKSQTPEINGTFGESVSFSGDGLSFAVGAIKEDCGFADNGYVYVFKDASGWSQDVRICGYGDGAYHFGNSVSLNNDGTRLAIGAQNDDSPSSGINGTKNTGGSGSNDSGAAYVYFRSGGVWSEEAYIKASNPDGGDNFGHSVFLSPDGLRLAVGSWNEESNAQGIGGDQSDNSNNTCGAVYVFDRNGVTWSQKSYVKASNSDSSDKFGHEVSLTLNGVILVVSAQQEDSNATGVNGDQSNNSEHNSGAVYIVE